MSWAILLEYGKASLGIALITAGWLAVMSLWRRSFPGTPGDEDVLAGRTSCHGCTCSGKCERQRGVE